MTERILGDSLGLLLRELRKRSFLFAGTAGDKKDVSLELLGRRQGLLPPWGQVLPKSVASDSLATQWEDQMLLTLLETLGSNILAGRPASAGRFPFSVPSKSDRVSDIFPRKKPITERK